MKIKLDGTLTSTQSKQHIPHAFTMPEGTTRLFIKLEYHPKCATGQNHNNMLCLTLFDPETCRGARHNNPDQSLSITQYTATPGYTAGKLQAGIWTIFIDTHRILPPEIIHYTLEIEFSSDVINATPAFQKTPTKYRGAGWYRGDLHSHTLHSDARWDVPDLVKYAHDYKLDFVTLTDHNTVSALAQLDSLASDDLLTMGGSELTTYYGHALALGVREWQEWRIGTGISMVNIAEQVKDKGGIFIIAHPKSIGDPECTGCDWNYVDMLPGAARHIEIWNGPWAGDSGNEKALQLWYQWLNQGYRMVATTGTDSHGPMKDPNPGFNHIYAEDLSEKAILNAIKQGHLYVSSGPRLELSASNEALEQVMMGDLITSNKIHCSLNFSKCSRQHKLSIIVNGETFQTHAVTDDGILEWQLPSQAKWCIVELRNEQGDIAAITNPIFVGHKNQWL